LAILLEPVVINSNVATGGGEVRTLFCAKYDVIFSYIYMNTTKLVLPYPI